MIKTGNNFIPPCRYFLRHVALQVFLRKYLQGGMKLFPVLIINIIIESIYRRLYIIWLRTGG